MVKQLNKKNFTEGPLFFRIILFALPIMLTGILQICYNMADNIVVGKFSGDPHALAAVGSTSSINSLILNLLIGISTGTGVVVSQLYGAGESKRMSRCIHTSLAFSLIGGIAMSIIGFAVSEPALRLIGIRSEFIDLSILYMRIICIGIPASSVYNFASSILRATGDSRSPLIILMSTGMVNVMLNMVFVIGMGMSVDGVAIATIVSQYLSAVASVVVLMHKKEESCRFSFKNICFDKDLLTRVLKYGVPAGLQGSMFSISNILITSGVNTFPPSTVTANTIASNIDAITLTAMSSFSQASMTFVGQNYGAMKIDRMKKSIIYCLIQVFVVGSLISGLELLFGRQLISLYIDSTAADAAEVSDIAYSIITLLLTTYVICGIMDTISGALKGLGYAFICMIINVFCICVIRVVWIYTIFRLESFHTIIGLYTVYPVSWTLSLIAMVITTVVALRKIRKSIKPKEKEDAEKATV